MVGRCHFLNLGGVSIIWKPLLKPRSQRGYENRCNRFLFMRRLFRASLVRNDRVAH